MTTPTTLPVRLDPATGEVLPTFDWDAYTRTLTAERTLARQQELAGAYDRACAALLGPNDVQTERGRTFKKKSAWRKLARHFGLSTAVLSVQRDVQEHPAGPAVFVATVTVRATAPWGQSSEAVGACATDEAVGRRTITIADAIATAETRATNRAISNLIAMGEVPAEEVAPSRGGANGPPDAIPFGKQKGKKLVECSVEHLTRVRRWCEEKGEFGDLVEAIEAELERRRAADGGDTPAGTETEGLDDDLPF